MTAQDKLNENIPTPDNLVLVGPNGASLHFTHPAMGLYREAEVFLPGKFPVLIKFDDSETRTAMLVDGVEASANNFAFAGRLMKSTPWSLSLWSLKGEYVILTTYAVIDNHIDLRNGRFVNAYSTSSGDLIHFKGPSSSLAGGGFLKWSPTKPDVALLEGRKGIEEATPEK